MPIPTVITDLSTTAASNYPSGGDSPIVLDDVQRAHASFIAQLRLGTVFATTALASMGAAALGANTDITSLTGTTTNNNAATGKIGEYLESELALGSALNVLLASSGATNTPTGVSLSITAGDWDVSFLAATTPSAGTVTQLVVGHLDTNAAGTYTIPNNGGVGFINPPATANLISVLNGHKRFSLNATTTVYLRIRADFTVSNMGIYGGIYARRVR